MKNDYSKMFNSVSPAKLNEGKIESIETKKEEIPKNKEYYSIEYKGSWKATTNVNVRSKPDMSGDIVAIVNKGDKIDCDGYYAIEKAGSSDIVWLKTNLNGKDGYTMNAYYSRR